MRCSDVNETSHVKLYLVTLLLLKVVDFEEAASPSHSYEILCSHLERVAPHLRGSFLHIDVPTRYYH